MRKKNSNNNLIDNNKIFNTVSIVDGDEVVDRNNDEYIYLDAVGGIITQPQEISTVQNRQSIDVLKNQLLGQFNTKTGKYEISNNIELELQHIVKVETSWVGNATFAESLSSFGGLGKLKFVVKTSVSKGTAHSELYIFERVNKMANTVTNTQIQQVAEFSRTNESYINFESLTFENYFRFAWEYFKIVKINQSFYMSEDERFLQGWIVRRKLYLQNMDEKLDASIELAESDLLLERIEILSGLGEYGFKVLGRFEELKNQAIKIVKTDLTARDQNEILEEAIETFRGKYVKEQEQFFEKQYNSVESYTKTISNLKDQNHKQVLNEIEMRMPTVVEVIKREDERRLEEERIKEAVKEAKTQTTPNLENKTETVKTETQVEQKGNVKKAQVKPAQQKQAAQQQAPSQQIKISPPSVAELKKVEAPASSKAESQKAASEPTVSIPTTTSSYSSDFGSSSHSNLKEKVEKTLDQAQGKGEEIKKIEKEVAQIVQKIEKATNNKVSKELADFSVGLNVETPNELAERESKDDPISILKSLDASASKTNATTNSSSTSISTSRSVKR